VRYTLQFYGDGSGREPVRAWLDHLPQKKRAAVVAGLQQVLGRLGLEVCRTECGKHLGKGLAEFRLRHSEQVILGKFVGPEARERRGSDESVLVRVFFHAHGDKLILLLGAYDKGRHPSARRQEKEIAAARKRLREWQARQQRRKP
jgi:phage-related protein